MSKTMSGRVSTSRSLLPRSSFACDLNRSPRKSSSVSLWRWIIVPIAPSRTRIRCNSSVSSRVRTEGIVISMNIVAGFHAAGDEYRKGIAGQAGTGAHRHMLEPGTFEESRDLFIFEPEPSIAHAIAYPGLIVLAQIQHEHVAAGPENPRGLDRRVRRVGRMMQRLRQQRNVDAGIGKRQLLDLAAFPRDVRHAAPLGQLARPAQYFRGPIDADHALRPSRRLDRQIALTARDVGDIHGRKQQAQRARPRRPASARDELGAVGAVHVEILFAETDHFVQPRLVSADRRG